jgi:D-threo-aldose 1-dehydrogenase
MTLRELGATGLPVTPVCIGTSPLASMPNIYGYEVGAERAEATVEAVLDGPVNFLDTSNNYGAGNAETRIGAVLRRRGGPGDR